MCAWSGTRCWGTGVPVVPPAGGHCILIDVKQIPEFKDFKYPVASFLAWMYLNTGIRAAGHSVGMQKHTSINDLVRLAIPVGMKLDEVDDMIARLLQLFDKKINIPEIVLESSAPQPLGIVYANYRLVNYHRATGKIVAAPDFTSDDQQNDDHQSDDLQQEMANEIPLGLASHTCCKQAGKKLPSRRTETGNADFQGP